jgi:hypothetical protein
MAHIMRRGNYNILQPLLSAPISGMSIYNGLNSSAASLSQLMYSNLLLSGNLQYIISTKRCGGGWEKAEREEGDVMVKRAGSGSVTKTRRLAKAGESAKEKHHA